MAKRSDFVERARKELRDNFGTDSDPIKILSHFEDDDFDSKIKCVIAIYEEALRLWSPAPISVARVAKQDFTFDGVEYPEGVGFVVPYTMMSNDLQIFDEPFKFMPERFLE